MKTYEYGRIQVLADRLAEAGIPSEIVGQIMSGGEEITKIASSERKAAWMRGAMERMDQLLDRPTRSAVREACACCLGGKRLEISKCIARQFATVEESIAAANEAKLVFGHSVTREDDGSILVRFSPEGLGAYRCACLPKATEPLSITYCTCCCGHVKHHLQTALGCRCEGDPVSSSLSSGGKSRARSFSGSWVRQCRQQEGGDKAPHVGGERRRGCSGISGSFRPCA